jgi:hypothetical protein
VTSGLRRSSARQAPTSCWRRGGGGGKHRTTIPVGRPPVRRGPVGRSPARRRRGGDGIRAPAPIPPWRAADPSGTGRRRGEGLGLLLGGEANWGFGFGCVEARAGGGGCGGCASPRPPWPWRGMSDRDTGTVSWMWMDPPRALARWIAAACCLRILGEERAAVSYGPP